MSKFKLNGETHHFKGDGEMPLLWYLRDEAGLKGAKFGCGIGSCGACTIHVDGEATRSCITAMDDIDGVEITTIEGLSEDGSHPLQIAWVEEDVAQCGYCQTGQIMAAASFLKDNPNPSDADIDDGMTNLCRCGTYTRMRKALHKAADAMKGEG